MNGYNFTERVRKVLQFAREEANAIRHEYVGTEHILLGLCREGEGVAAAALQNLDVDSGDVRDSILKVVKPGPTGSHMPVDLPYTSRVKKTLELAMQEAHELQHSYVGTEHLLLGLLREAHASLRLSWALRRRGARGDVERAAALETSALAIGRELGMARLLRDARSGRTA